MRHSAGTVVRIVADDREAPGAYFAESIVNPSVVIEKGKGYEAADGSSKMPSHNDSLTVQELIDLVAYLRSSKPSGGSAGGHRH